MTIVNDFYAHPRVRRVHSEVKLRRADTDALTSQPASSRISVQKDTGHRAAQSVMLRQIGWMQEYE